MNDIKYTKTGEGTSSASIGFENGPFQKWNTQPSTPLDAGYQIPYDQNLGTIFTDLMPQVVFKGFPERIVNSNVASFKRGDIYEESDIDDGYNLDAPLQLQARKGELRTVALSHALNLHKIFQNFELRTAGEGYLQFEYQQAINGFARKYETLTVNDLIAGGVSAQDQLVKKADGSIDIYNTMLNMRKKLIERGANPSELDLFVTPDIVNLFMNDNHYVSNYGNFGIAAEEVRTGFKGKYLDFNIIESGRLNQIRASLSTKANMIFAIRSQVVLCRFPVQPIQLKLAPTNYIDCSILSGLEYFKHYIVNDYGVQYIVTDAE